MQISAIQNINFLRYHFPFFPSDRTLLAVPDGIMSADENMINDWQVDCLELSDDNQDDNPEKLPKKTLLSRKLERVLRKVKAILEDEEALKKIWQKIPEKGDTVEEYEENRRLRIRELLRMAEVEEEMYYAALRTSKRGVVVVLKRDLDEINIEPYNPEWIKSWNGNISFRVCGDFFGVITYVTEYYMKDETNTMDAIMEVLKNNPDKSTRERMKAIADAFLKRRQIGESEGCYKLLSDLLLKNSNTTCVWLSLESPADRVKRMRRAGDEVTEENQIYKKIDGAEGLWSEQSDLMSKWLRRANMEDEREEDSQWADVQDLSLAQFAKMYTSSKSGEDKQRDGTEGHNIQHDDIYPEEVETEDSEEEKKM